LVVAAGNGDEHVHQPTAALAVASICILTAGCGSGTNQGAKTSTTRSTATTTTAPPLADTALPALLLSPEQVNTAMGATEMTVAKTHFEMSDDSATMEPKECLAVDGSAQAQVYADSGYTAERDQTLQEGDNFTHYVQQAVVLFPSAKQAGAFFIASVQQWPACRQYTHTQSGSLWDVAPISNTNGTLSTIATQQNANEPGWACGRALAQRNNVLIDVNTCSADPADSAVNIANQIAARVPT
jgi:PknH-like extracellular domain